jgi:hypothetical protein
LDAYVNKLLSGGLEFTVEGLVGGELDLLHVPYLVLGANNS